MASAWGTERNGIGVLVRHRGTLQLVGPGSVVETTGAGMLMQRYEGGHMTLADLKVCLELLAPSMFLLGQMIAVACYRRSHG